MYDKGKIIFGIIVFLILFSSPFWLNLAGGTPKEKPEPALPSQYKECVAPKDFIVANHMDILNQWRDMVVRNDKRLLVVNGKNFILNGEKAEMSLTSTCMKCHNDKKNFCDQCHNYLDVSPYCWDCHIDPALVNPATLPQETFLRSREEQNGKDTVKNDSGEVKK